MLRKPAKFSRMIYRRFIFQLRPVQNFTIFMDYSVELLRQYIRFNRELYGVMGVYKSLGFGCLGIFGLPLGLTGLISILALIAEIWEVGEPVQFRTITFNLGIPSIPGWVGIVLLFTISGGVLGFFIGRLLQQFTKARMPSWSCNYFRGITFNSITGIKMGAYYAFFLGLLASWALLHYQRIFIFTLVGMGWLLLMVFFWRTELLRDDDSLWFTASLFLIALLTGAGLGRLIYAYFPFYFFLA